MELLQKTIQAIGPLDAAAMAAAQKEIDYCLKPPGSLGTLEDIVRGHPEQWLWLHRRWPRSPGDIA